MKIRILFGALTCQAALLVAQPAPPPIADASSATTVAGSISQFNYGADGRVTSILVAPNTLVNLPPDWALQMEILAKAGSQLRATGALMTAASGMRILQAQSVNVGGRSMTLAAPAQPAPYAGSGVIRSLNYGPQGEVNGFVWQNGMIARTPAFGASDLSVLRPGATISLSGFARTTASGRTVIDAQSISANGQTIAMNIAPRSGPDAGPRGKRVGPRRAGPPPRPRDASGPRPPAPDAAPPPPPADGDTPGPPPPANP